MRKTRHSRKLSGARIPEYAKDRLAEESSDHCRVKHADVRRQETCIKASEILFDKVKGLPPDFEFNRGIVSGMAETAFRECDRFTGNGNFRICLAAVDRARRVLQADLNRRAVEAQRKIPQRVSGRHK